MSGSPTVPSGGFHIPLSGLETHSFARENRPLLFTTQDSSPSKRTILLQNKCPLFYLQGTP